MFRTSRDQAAGLVSDRRRHGVRRPHRFQPRLEGLEDRCLLSGGYTVTNLVSNQAGQAPIQDSNLVNAWGIGLGPYTDFWVSDNNTGVTTVYGGDVNGSPFTKSSLTVTIPGGNAAGQVYNPTSDFVVSNGNASGPALFIFGSDTGQITGWNPGVPSFLSTQAQPEVSIAGASFTGIAIGHNSRGNFLYAADFTDKRIDVFNKNFGLATLSGSFTDPQLPKDYAPFDVQNVGGKLYITYARQDKSGAFLSGPNRGFVDVFDTNGNFLRRLITHEHLDEPWGVVLAPSNFGQFSNDLLVGNLDTGHINAFDPNTGEFEGRLKDTSGNPIAIDELWGLKFGNGTTAGDTNALYFAAGPNNYANGLFGKITVAPGGPGGDAALVTAPTGLGETGLSHQAVLTSPADPLILSQPPAAAGPEVGGTHTTGQGHQRSAGAMAAARDLAFATLGHARRSDDLTAEGLG
jgi:uncharacterized protein (TIGR03118 family)